MDLDNAARLLEENKSIVLETNKLKLGGDMADNKAEKLVRASPEWAEYIKAMVQARTDANRAKQKLKWIEMRHREQESFEATKRAEMKL